MGMSKIILVLLIGGYIQHSINANLLEKLVNLSIHDRLIDYKYLKLLKFLIHAPGIASYDVYSSKCGGYRYPSGPQRDFRFLLNHNLIEVVEEENNSIAEKKRNDAKPYRISLSGICYIILNDFVISFDDLIISLLKNYGDNVLFTFFLYPFISRKTLVNGEWDSAFFSIVFSYLRDICKAINDSARSLKKMCFKTGDGYLTKQVILWHNNPNKNNPQNFSDVNLRNYLGWTLGWDWVDSATITPKPDENMIEILDVSDTQRKFTIFILKDENRAVLRRDGTKIYEFFVSPTDSFLSIEAKTPKKIIDFIEMPFVMRWKDILISFITKFGTQIKPWQPYYGNLHQDENFKEALEFLDMELKVKE